MDSIIGGNPSQASSDGDLSDLLGDSNVVPMPGSNRAVALDLAARAFVVFPCNADKRPLTRHSFRDATTDADQIRAWWRTWPDALPALPTGARTGIAVLDIDRKNGKDGYAELRRLGFDPDSLSPVMTRTPSGGCHLFFAHRDGLKNWSKDEIAPGLDVRTEGGLVIAPGSFKDGGRYTPLGHPLGSVELPPFPDALIPPAKPERTPVAVLDVASAEQRAWAAARLHGLTGALAAMSEGGRNATLNDAAMWAGGAAAQGGMIDRETAHGLLGAACERNGLPRREFESTFRSGWDAGLRRPISDFPREITADDFENIDSDPYDLSDLLGDEPKTESYALDEDGVIRAFTARHDGELLFDHHVGRWFRFDGNVWRREETKLAHHYARDLSTKFARTDPKVKALKQVRTWEAVERGARTVREFACTSDTWNRDPWLLGTPGGTVDLRTGELRRGRPEDRISRLASVAPVPPAAFDPSRDCPLWLAFLHEALGSNADGGFFAHGPHASDGVALLVRAGGGG